MTDPSAAVTAAEAAMDAATRVVRRSRRIGIVAVVGGVLAALLFGAGVYVVGHLANAVDSGNRAAGQRDAILRHQSEQADQLRALQDRSAEVDDRQSAFLATVARLLVASPAEQPALRAQLGEFAQPGAFDPDRPRPSTVPAGPAPGSSPPSTTSTTRPPGPTSTAPPTSAATTTTTRRRVLPTVTVSVPPPLPHGRASSSSSGAAAMIVAALVGFALLGAAVHASLGPDTYPRRHGSPLRPGPRPPEA